MVPKTKFKSKIPTNQRRDLRAYDSSPSFARSITPATPRRVSTNPTRPTRISLGHLSPFPMKKGRLNVRRETVSLGLGTVKNQDRVIDVVKVDIHGKRREFYPPSFGDVNDDGGRPDRKIKLDWVYGYRGRDARSNLHVLPAGELLYYVASIAVIYNKRKEIQRHYLGHNEDITSICLHPNESYVATGQLSGSTQDSQAHVRVWDVRTLATHAIVGLGVFHIGISSLSFSQQTDGVYLMAIDEGEKHVLSVWDWQKESLLAKSTTTVDTVVWGTFYPHDDTVLITFGKQHIYFWRIFWDNKARVAKILRDKASGNFRRDDVPKFVTSLTFARNGDVITGDSGGRISVWSKSPNDAYVLNQKDSESMRHAHKKSVFSLTMLEDDILVSGAGNELKGWDTTKGYELVYERQLPESAGQVRTVTPTAEGGSSTPIYIGTTKNVILEGCLDPQSQERFKYTVLGHSEELWAMCTHPEEHSFITAGYDMKVCKWSAVSHKLVWRVHVDRPCLTAAFDPHGDILAIGTTAGQLTLLDGHNGQLLCTISVGTEQLDCVQFSPDGMLLAVGSHDHQIYIFTMSEGGRALHKYKHGTLKGHKNFLMQIDWSSDSQFLQSISGDYDLMFWDGVNLQPERNSRSLRDTDWHTHSCTLGYTMLGAWSNLNDGEDINSTSRSHYRDILAIGDNRGSIRLYKYPCSTHKAEYTERKAYSSHVTGVEFLFDDSYLITTGGTDAGVLQWSVVDVLTPR